MISSLLFYLFNNYDVFFFLFTDLDGFLHVNCAYGSLRYFMTMMMCLVLSNSPKKYCFNLFLKFLNLYLMLRCSENVTITAPDDGTSPVKLAWGLFPGRLFLPISLLLFLLLLLLFPSYQSVAALLFE